MSLNGRSFADIQPEKPEWLWQGRIPLGGITLLAGEPKRGKSLLTCRLAAVTSRKAHVFIANGEDALAARVRPRLAAAGADLRFVHPLSRDLRLPHDIAELREAVLYYSRTDLIVIDPLKAFLPSNINSWHDQSVRRALAPLAYLAEEVGCAVVIVVHLNKQGTIGDSVGLVGAARSVLKLKADGKRRVLEHLDTNYDELQAPVAYRIDTVKADGMIVPKLVSADDPVVYDYSSEATGALLTPFDDSDGE